MRSRAASLEPAATLADVLDRVLDTGVVAAGEAVLSVADVDLVYLNLRALLASVQTLLDPEASNGSKLPAAVARSENGPSERRPALPIAETGVARTSGRRSGARPSVPEKSASDALDVLERFARSPAARAAGGHARINTDPEHVERGLAGLVLTVIDLLRELMERQAIRRMERGSLEAHEVERLGRTFLALKRRMEELMDAFGLEEGDLGLGLGLDVEDLG